MNVVAVEDDLVEADLDKLFSNNKESRHGPGRDRSRD